VIETGEDFFRAELLLGEDEVVVENVLDLEVKAI
jgi:hypothetical protein